MSIKTPREHWQDYCEVAPQIRERHGLGAAIGYVVGEKLMAIAQSAETDAAFRAELPDFCKAIRALFTKAEILDYFASAERSARVESDLFTGANEEEADELREIVEDARREGERRSWVKAMLLQTGS